MLLLLGLMEMSYFVQDMYHLECLSHFYSHLVKTGLEDNLISLNRYKINLLKASIMMKKSLSLSTVKFLPKVTSKC